MRKSFKAQFPKVSIQKGDSFYPYGKVKIPNNKSIGFKEYNVSVMNGMASSIHGVTGRRSVTEEALPALKGKYGEPKDMSMIVENEKGGKYNLLFYVWELPDGISIQLMAEEEKGMIMVSTKEWSESVKKHDEKKKKSLKDRI